MNPGHTGGPLAGYVPRQRPWSAVELLENVDQQVVPERCRAKVDAFEPVLWNDLISEYDSRCLSEAISKNRSSYSTSFLALIDFWQVDERNHYSAFEKIYSIFYREGTPEVAKRVARRPVDLSAIEGYLSDEFSLLLLLAYDEIVTTHAYRCDFPFYDEIGIPQLGACIRAVSRDEGIHFRNMIRLIQMEYRHRLPETKAILWKIVSSDIGEDTYSGTFVMDHKLPYPLFPLTKEELVTKCAGKILSLLTNVHSFE